MCRKEAIPTQLQDLYHWPFEIGLCSGKEGGTAASAVWELVYLFAPCPLEPRSTPTHTGGASGSSSLRIGETRCAPFQKSKSKRLLVLHPSHAETRFFKKGADLCRVVSL